MILLNDPKGHVEVESHRIVRSRGEGTGVYPSDHYPVFADLVPGRREPLVVQAAPGRVRPSPSLA